LRGSLGDCALTQSREHGTNVWTADATLAAPKDSVVTQNAPQTFEHNRRAAVPLSRALNIIKRRQEQWAREL
jgi:hypothetical protein